MTATRVQVILNDELAEVLKLIAAAKKRSVSNMACYILEEYLESPEVQNDAKLISLRQGITDIRIRAALEGANLSAERLRRVNAALNDPITEVQEP